MTAKIPVSVLGATGTVGQKFVRLLADHPWFEVAAVAASSASAGKRYGDVVRWREQSALPDRIAALIVQPSRAAAPGADRVLRARRRGRGADRAGVRGAPARYVVTNTRTHRMDADVPLLIPEANARPPGAGRPPAARAAAGRAPSSRTRTARRPRWCWRSRRCTARSALEKLFVSTMQAVSGAGYPGVASLDILGNVVPYIGGEEEKMERESRKILGTLAADGVTPADFAVSAHTNRVATVDGHLMTVSVGFRTRVTPESRRDRAARVPREPAGAPACRRRPRRRSRWTSAPDRPQPRLDLERGRGMAVTVGRVRACPILDLRLVLLGHNTIRGAAGQAVQIAELLVAEGRVDRPA